jgi:hypothetical protein
MKKNMLFFIGNGENGGKFTDFRMFQKLSKSCSGTSTVRKGSKKKVIWSSTCLLDLPDLFVNVEMLTPGLLEMARFRG